MVFRTAPPGRRPFTIWPKVIVARPEAELRLLGRLPVVFSGEHSFVLSPDDSGTRTTVVQGEIYRGLVVPFIGKTIAAAQMEFEQVNQALRRRVEQDPVAPRKDSERQPSDASVCQALMDPGAPGRP